MKRIKCLAGLAAVVLSLGMALVGCDNGAEGGGDGSRNVTASTTSDRAAFLGNFGGVPFMNDFKARFTHQSATVGADTKVIVLSDTYDVQSALPDIEAAYERGAVIVLIEPGAAQKAALSDALGFTAAVSHDGTGMKQDMYAFNKFNEHHVLVHDASLTTGGGSAEITTVTVDEATGETLSEETGTVNLEPGRFEINWASQIDALVTWIDASDDGEMSPRQAPRSVSGDLQDLMHAQKVAITFTVSSPGQFLVDGIDIQPASMLVTDQYYIWALYDKDAHEDYYIVQEDITLPNENLGYVENYAAGGTLRYTGWYLQSYDSNHIPKDRGGTSLALDSGAYLERSSPETSNNSETVTTGMSWGLSGNLGFNGLAGTGGIGANVSFTNSTSVTIPDFKAYNQCETNTAYSTDAANTKWEYSNQRELGHSIPAGTDRTIYVKGSAPDLATRTANFHNMWVWRMPVPNMAIDCFQMEVVNNVLIGANVAYSPKAWQYDYGQEVILGMHTGTILMMPPPRG